MQTHHTFFIFIKNCLGIDRGVLVKIISWLFILLFFYAATSKLLDYEKFKAQMGQSSMLTPYVAFLAWAVPSFEVLIGLLLFIPRTMLIGLYASFTLMMVFTNYIAIMLVSGGKIPCSCGGILQNMTWFEHLIFNILFATIAILGIIMKTKVSENKSYYLK